MFTNEEKKLNEYKKEFENIELPEEALDKAIEAGFQKGKQERKRKPRVRFIMSAAMVAILLIGFFTSIRISPAFANYLSTLPGMEKIVELIRHDKGMMTAIEYEYYEELGVSSKENGIEVIIDGAIADENGLVLFYTLNANERQKEMFIESAKLKSLDGEEIVFGSMSYGFPHRSEEGEKSYSGTMEYFFQEPLTAREFQMDLEVKADSITEDFSLNFALTDEIKTKKTYSLNKTVTIEGQKIEFVEATVYPLRVAVHIKMDPENSKKLLEFEDLRLVDEYGEAWTKIVNGATGSRISENEVILYLQSNYFNEPEELYLAFNRIQAIDKEDSDIVVDIQEGKILKQPPGNKLRDLQVGPRTIRFNLYTEKEFSYSLFSVAKDGDGNKIDINSNFWSGRESGVSEMGVEIENLKTYKNPISLELSFFPEWIKGEQKIKIK